MAQISTENPNINSQNKNETSTASCSNASNLDDIPAITIRQIKDENSHLADRQYHDSQRILPLQIIDIFLSELVSKKPTIYTFAGHKFRYTQIVGTIVSKKKKTDNKINIGVDDGTGYISCFMESSDSDYKQRSVVEKRLESCFHNELMEKDELLKFAKMRDEEFLQKLGSRHNSFINACAKMLGEKIKKTWKEYPLINEINIGDNVKIVGTVSDYMNQRFLFIQYLNRPSTARDTAYEMAEIFASKDKLYKGNRDT